MSEISQDLSSFSIGPHHEVSWACSQVVLGVTASREPFLINLRWRQSLSFVPKLCPVQTFTRAPLTLHYTQLWLYLLPSGFPGGSDSKESACSAGDRFSPWVRKMSRRGERLLTSVLLLGEFHGQRSLVGYSAWGRRVRHNWVTNTHSHFLLMDKLREDRNLFLLAFLPITSRMMPNAYWINIEVTHNLSTSSNKSSER